MADTTFQNITTQTQLPDWYKTYLQQVMGRALGSAGEPYQGYQGPLVAGLTGDQNASYDMVRGLQGAQTGNLNQALGLYGQAGAGHSGDAGAGSFGSASGLFNQGAGANTAGVSQPFVNQGAGLAGAAGAGSALSAANPYLQASTQPTGLQAAAPFLGAASQSLPQGISSYMNPYNDAVTGQIAKLGARNLQENLLPAISDQFVSSGQYGSQRQGVLDDRALRDTQENILAQQNQALQQGYTTAGNQFQADQSRLAGLAGTAGGLGTSQQQILQGAGAQTGNLSATDLQRLLSSGQTIGSLGISQAGIAGTDANRQIAAGQGMYGIGQSQIQAQQNDSARQLAAAQGIQGLSGQAQNMGFQQAGALDAAGQEQQANTQGSYNATYGQFQQQVQYPWTQIGNLSNVIQGLPVNQSTTQSSQTSTPGPSGISQVAGLGLGVAGLANSGIFKAKGGAVKKRVTYSATHSYGNTPRRGIGQLETA